MFLGFLSIFMQISSFARLFLLSLIMKHSLLAMDMELNAVSWTREDSTLHTW